MTPKPATFNHVNTGITTGWIVKDMGSFVKFKQTLETEMFEDLPVQSLHSSIKPRRINAEAKIAA